LRDGAADGVEVFLIRRVLGMPFAGGVTAYPGGGVDPRDADRDLAWAGTPPAGWARSFGCSEPLAQALVCAAVRETFEEVGVLLASAAGGAVLPTVDEGWEAERRGLLDRTHSLAEVLQRRELVLRADLLRPWAHWITPEGEVRRYDTRFFVAAIPSDVDPQNVGTEADEAIWVDARHALSEWDSGSRPMLPPTVQTLRDVAEHSSVAEVLASAPSGLVSTVNPRLDHDGDGTWIVLPDGGRVRSPIPLGRPPA
jgi:8-oxo-dGTP pyrophosphatase MutT (NUDIX family)